MKLYLVVSYIVCALYLLESVSGFVHLKEHLSSVHPSFSRTRREACNNYLRAVFYPPHGGGVQLNGQVPLYGQINGHLLSSYDQEFLNRQPLNSQIHLSKQLYLNSQSPLNGQVPLSNKIPSRPLFTYY